MLVDIDFIKPEELDMNTVGKLLESFPDIIRAQFPEPRIREMYKTSIYPERYINTVGLYDAWNLDEKYFELYCKNYLVENMNPDLDEIPNKSITDNPFKIRKMLSEFITDRKFVILACKITKDSKINGDYIKWETVLPWIGENKITKEYIKDEEWIDFLFLTKILELKEKV